MTREELEMRALVRESDVIDRTDGSELAKAFNCLWEKYVEQSMSDDCISRGRSTATIMRDIRHLPSVTPIEKTGKWIYIGNGNNGLHQCNQCGAERKMFDGLEIYCSSCGAKMVEPQERSE